MGLGGVAIATLPSVIFPKLMFSDRLGGGANIMAAKHELKIQQSHAPDFRYVFVALTLRAK